MTSLYLMVRIAGQPVALPAANVGSVVEIEEISPVPRVAPHVAGLFALRSRVLTVIDTRTALGLGQTARDGIMTAVIVTSDTHSYALLVEGIDDVIEAPPPEPCPAVLGLGWERAALGAVRHADGLTLVIDPGVLLAGTGGVVATAA